MNKIVKRLETEFSKIPDLVIKKINLSIFKTMYLIYLETVSSSNKVNDYILKNIILKKDEINKNNISSYIAAPNTLEIKNVDECEFYLTNGFSHLYMLNNKALGLFLFLHFQMKMVLLFHLHFVFPFLKSLYFFYLL